MMTVDTTSHRLLEQQCRHHTSTLHQCIFNVHAYSTSHTHLHIFELHTLTSFMHLSNIHKFTFNFVISQRCPNSHNLNCVFKYFTTLEITLCLNILLKVFHGWLIFSREYVFYMNDRAWAPLLTSQVIMWKYDHFPLDVQIYCYQLQPSLNKRFYFFFKLKISYDIFIWPIVGLKSYLKLTKRRFTFVILCPL